MMTVPPQLTSSLPSFSYPASFRHPPPASSIYILKLYYIISYYTTLIILYHIILYHIILYYIIVVFLQFHINMPNCLRPSVAHFWPIFDPCGDKFRDVLLDMQRRHRCRTICGTTWLYICNRRPADLSLKNVRPAATDQSEIVLKKWEVHNYCNANWLASDYCQHFWCNSIQLISRSNFK